MERFLPISVESIREHRRRLGRESKSECEEEEQSAPDSFVLRRSKRLASARPKPAKCTICASIVRVALSEEDLSLRIGRVAAVLSSRCRIHREILQQPPEVLRTCNPRRQVSVSRLGGNGAISIHFPDAYDPTREQVRFLPLPRQQEDTRQKRARIVHRHWIDYRTLRGWIRACEHTHGAPCKNPPEVGGHDQGPDWVIDVWRRNLVSFRSEMRYCALSYVWGQVKSLQTFKECLEAHKVDGAFGKDVTEIPKVIQDSMSLTEMLGERYLWVDMLCIVQDDNSKYDQLNKMASIFAGSHVAFVAEHGSDANHSLKGFAGISEPRNFEQQIVHFPRRCSLVSQRTLLETPRPYWTRGWTYQEFQFARKKLVFKDGTVYWQCNRSTWNEDEIMTATPARSDGLWKSTARLWPNLRAYSEAVRGYMYRTFTYEEDAYFAFAGTIFEYSKLFQGGFLYGIPEMFFDVAMLWGPHSIITRRPVTHGSKQHLVLPTWSWMAWQGSLESWSWYSGYDYLIGENPSSTRTFQLVQWYCQKSLTLPKRPILVSNRLYMNRVWKQPEDLPPGWASHRVQPPMKYDFGECLPPFRDDVFYQSYFKHESDPNTLFWYPIPVGPGTAPIIRDPEPYLSCKTKRCWLQPGELHAISMPEIGQPDAYLCTLLDREGKWAGALHLHTKTDAEYLSKTATPETKIELVAISWGFAYNDCENYDIIEWDLEDRPKSEDMYHFYNVLWVEWEGPIAFRKALGRVLSTCWDSQELEPVDLVLC